MQEINSIDKAKLIFIAGPTAVGKTHVAIQLAKHFSTEIVSADSRQVYKELSIGVARPSTAELNKVAHHLIAHQSIQSLYTVAQYEKQAHKQIADVIQRTGKCIVCGGSGLFIDAIRLGLDQLPPAAPSIREKLQEELNHAESRTRLLAELKEIDPISYQTIDLNNDRRIIRAIEVYRLTGSPMSSLIGKRKPLKSYPTYHLLLDMDRSLLYDRINRRYDAMLQEGLLEEVRSVYAFKDHPALKTVGYSEWFDHLDGTLTFQEATHRGKQKSRNYAKRQLTWFRHHGNWKVYDPIIALKQFIK